MSLPHPSPLRDSNLIASFSHILFIHLAVDGHQMVPIFGSMNNTSMNILLQATHIRISILPPDPNAHLNTQRHE